jgi:hypothetical protein
VCASRGLSSSLRFIYRHIKDDGGAYGWVQAPDDEVQDLKLAEAVFSGIGGFSSVYLAR